MTNPLVRKKSLETILSSFTKVVDDLRVLQHTNTQSIKRYDDQILAYNVLKDQATEENAKAASVEAKINSLLE